MAWSYERNLNHTYIVYDGIENDNNYEIQMIVRNPIKGLLTSHLDKIDGKVRLFYEISSKQPLCSIYEKKKMNYVSLKALLQSMQMIIVRMEEFLLSTEYLITDPKMIYVNPGKDEFYFCMVPNLTEDENSLHKLMEYLLDCIDYTDERAVAAAYEWYKKSGEDNNSFTKIFHEVFESDSFERKSIDHGQQKQTVWISHTSQHNPIDKIPDQASQTASNADKGDCITDSITINEEKPFENEESKKSPIAKHTLLAAGISLITVVLLLMAGIVLDFHKIVLEKVLVAVIAAGAAGGYLWYRRTEDYDKEEDELDFLSEPGDMCEEQNKGMWIDEDGVYRMGDESAVSEEVPTEDIMDTNTAAESDDYGETVYFQNDKINGSRRLEAVNRQFPEFVIELFPFIIGKLEGAVDGIVNDSTISRIHCKIEMEDGEYYITDLNSTNGTIVNGTALSTNTRTSLQIGDEILLGKVTYRFF